MAQNTRTHIINLATLVPREDLPEGLAGKYGAMVDTYLSDRGFYQGLLLLKDEPLPTILASIYFPFFRRAGSGVFPHPGPPQGSFDLPAALNPEIRVSEGHIFRVAAMAQRHAARARDRLAGDGPATPIQVRHR